MKKMIYEHIISEAVQVNKLNDIFLLALSLSLNNEKDKMVYLKSAAVSILISTEDEKVKNDLVSLITWLDNEMMEER